MFQFNDYDYLDEKTIDLLVISLYDRLLKLKKINEFEKECVSEIIHCKSTLEMYLNIKIKYLMQKYND